MHLMIYQLQFCCCRWCWSDNYHHCWYCGSTFGCSHYKTMCQNWWEI